MWKFRLSFNTLYIVFYVLSGARLHAQTPNLESLTAANGLSQGMVYDLLQDRRGFLWFATKDGLCRYDGYNFRVYHNDPFDPYSVTGNEIQTIFEDSRGYIWIGTPNNGADIFDPGTDRFYHLGQLVSPYVVSFAETPDGAVWIATNNGVFRLRLPIGWPANHQAALAGMVIDTFHWDDPDKAATVPADRISGMAVDRQGQLWVNTLQQIGFFNPATGQFKSVFDQQKKLSKHGDLLGCSLAVGPDGTMWAGHPDVLLHFYNGRIDRFPLPERSPFPLIEIIFDTQGDLYVSTRKQIYTLSAAEIETPARASFQLFYRFPADGIIGTTRMLFDRGGLLWIGTNGYGLRKYNPGDRHFRHFLAGTSPRRIAADVTGRLWLWRNGGKFRALLEDQNKLGEALLPDSPLLQHDCLTDRNGALWLLCEDDTGLQGKGVLVRLNLESLRPEAQYPLPVRISILSQLIEDRAGRLQIIGGLSTLTTFDPPSGTLKTADYSTTTGYQEIGYCLHEDVGGLLWIGTPHGLVRAEPGIGGPTFSIFKNNPQNRESLNCDVILATLDDQQAPDRYLWVGTKGGGLNRLDKTSGQCRHYTTADGLPNNVVYAIVPDSSGSLWLSTNCGLARFDPIAGHFQNFFKTDGLQDNEFNTASYARGHDGRLFFGGVNGVTTFYPSALAAATTSPPVILTGLRIQNHPLMPGDGVLEKSIEETTSITLAYHQNQLTFEFAAMDFSASQQNQYRYRLLGADRDWVEPTTGNTATYANLAAGNYVFEVTTGGSHGVWSGIPLRLNIHILPPWWATNSAYILYFLLVSAAAWIFYRFQINRLRLQNKLDFEHREAERLSELDRLKTNFFSSVTHEFRTPLTLILEPVRQLRSQVADRSWQYRLDLIDKNARRLLRYVNQLLDLSKLESGQMPLDLRPDSPAEVLGMVAETFIPLAEQQGIQLLIELPEDRPLLIFDREKLEQVAFNLLSNALKYTAKAGTVTLHVELSPTSILLEISDTGIGIPEASLPLVFDRFYQVGDSAAQGTGIGLALTKELVERMGGTIGVKSQIQKGTRFTVVIPAALADLLGQSREPKEAHLALPLIVAPDNPVDPGTAARQDMPPTPEELPLLLLIEDDQELRQFLRASLPERFRIAEAVDGAEGIRLARELVPDLVISDLMMPEKNGFEVCEALKNDPASSHIPLILLTAKSAVESRIQGLQEGADAYLTKPFRADELVAHIDNLIANRQRLQHAFSSAVTQQAVVESAAKVFDPRENEFLQKLIRVVEENLDNDTMDAETFARSIFMSRSQLHRKLSALTGLPLTEFVRNYRLDRARDMLARQEGSISEVAWRTGFPNAKYFSTCFRERFGQPPSMFRTGGEA